MNTDWRLFREQDKYLHGVILIKQVYKSSNPNNDHDHCEFCMSKFGNDVGNLTLGYCTEDRAFWICPQCYEDFRFLFDWRILNR